MIVVFFFSSYDYGSDWFYGLILWQSSMKCGLRMGPLLEGPMEQSLLSRRVSILFS